MLVGVAGSNDMCFSLSFFGVTRIFDILSVLLRLSRLESEIGNAFFKRVIDGIARGFSKKDCFGCS